MDYIKINEYPLERFGFGDEDYYDVDYFDGVGYQSAKIKGSVIKQAIINSVGNIYNTDGILTNDRTLTGDNFELFFQELGAFKVHSHKNNTDNVVIEVRNNTGFYSFIIKDHNTNEPYLHIKEGKVTINDAYTLPNLDGASGQVLKTNGAGVVSWANEESENIYNTNGTLTDNRTIDGNNNGIDIQNLDYLAIDVTNTGGTVLSDLMQININPTSIGALDRLYCIVDIIANKRRLAIIKTGEVVINEAYKLPLLDGTNGQVLTTNGAGVASWVTPTASTDFIPKVSGFNVQRFFIWANSSTTTYFSGLLSGGIGGTQSALLIGGATATKIIRTRFTSGTTSGSVAGYRGNGTDFFVGMGWHFVCTFGHNDPTFNSSAHNWIGLGNAITFQIGSLTYASSLGNIIGVGNDPTDSTLQILHNDSTGSATKIPLGADFPSNRTAGVAFSGMFCLELYNDYGSTSVKWRMTRIDTGTVEQGTISTNLPSASTGLCPVASRSNGSSTSLSAVIDVASIQIFTKY
jgi:hypothetical protein